MERQLRAVIGRRIAVFGRVQGVFFRHSAKEQADRLGIAGRAVNASDGSVRIEAEGEANAVETLIDWCRKGPSFADVEGIEVEEGECIGRRGFEI